MSRVRHIEMLLEELYEEHVDSFTYMMEQPYTFHYFCETYCNELYEKYLALKESHLTCKTCGETKEHKQFRKRKGGLVNTACKRYVNVKYIPDPLRAHLNAIRCRAKANNLPFNLTEEDLTIPVLCPVLNIPIHQSWGSVNVEANKDNCPSVDRLIPSLGYVKHNIRIISYRANRIKTDSTPQEIKLVYEYTMRESDRSWLEHCKLK